MGQLRGIKTRLVAKGFTQKECLDYHETFSPVAKIMSMILLLSLAAVKGWYLHQFDVSNSFLRGNLNEEVYIRVII